MNWWRAIITGSVVLAMLRGLLVLARTPDVGGLLVTRDEQPDLHALVDEVVRDTGLPAPDEIRLDIELNAYATERARFLGLKPGGRTMVLGLALLDAVTPAGLRGIIAHELGHHAGGDTRLGALEYRVNESLRRTVDMLGAGLLRWVFRAYHRLVARLTLASRRRQELEADAAGVRAAGSDAFAASLVATGPAGIVFEHYLDDYVIPVLEAGAVPADLGGGFRAMLADPQIQERQAELARLIAEDDEPDPYDSHPPLTQRLENVGRADATAYVPLPAGAPTGRSLLRDPDAVDQQTVAVWIEGITGGAARDTMTWQEAANEVFAPGVRDVASAASETVAAVIGRETAGIADVIQLIQDGRGAEMATALEVELDSEDELTGFLEELLGAVVAVHLVREHDWRWTVRWSGSLTATQPHSDTSVYDQVQEAVRNGAWAPLRRLVGLDRPPAGSGGKPGYSWRSR